MIIKNIHDMATIVSILKSNNIKIIVSSGGVDPLHIGHTRLLQNSIDINAVLIAIVNGDGFLIRKKGKPFMQLEERMEIVDAIRGVDFVVPWDDGSQTVIGALEILKPDYFTKGGDRSDENKVPEAEICAKIGCTIRYGIGGREKIQSSSSLIKNAQS